MITRDRRAHLVRANLGLEKLRHYFRLAVELEDLRRLMVPGLATWDPGANAAKRLPANDGGASSASVPQDRRRAGSGRPTSPLDGLCGPFKPPAVLIMNSPGRFSARSLSP